MTTKVFVGMYLAPEDVARIDREAARMGHRRSSWVRWVVREALDKAEAWK